MPTSISNNVVKKNGGLIIICASPILKLNLYHVCVCLFGAGRVMFLLVAKLWKKLRCWCWTRHCLGCVVFRSSLGVPGQTACTSAPLGGHKGTWGTRVVGTQDVRSPTHFSFVHHQVLRAGCVATPNFAASSSWIVGEAS